MSYISFDPGSTTGWAMFDDEGNFVKYGQSNLQELMSLCEEWRKEPIKVVIYEDFQVFRHKASRFTGSRMEVTQAIGVIKALANALNAKLVSQPSSIKPIAEKFTQVKPKGDHKDSHWVDAMNHGAYWLVSKGLRKTALESELENEL